jgi:two-component system, LytTR family, response regulator
MNTIIIGSNKKETTAIEQLLSGVQTVTVLKTFEKASDAQGYLTKHPDSSIFLSADLLGESSAELMDQLSSQPPVVVFSTSSDHAMIAFDEGVADFIVLPSSQARVIQALKRLELRIEKKDKLSTTSGLKDMYVRSNAKSLRVLFSDVLFIEAMADYVIIHTEGFKYIVHYTMKGIQDQLPSDIFVRAHRSFIVNLDKIHAIDNQEIIIKDKRIPIGGSNKDYFFSRLNLI